MWTVPFRKKRKKTTNQHARIPHIGKSGTRYLVPKANVALTFLAVEIFVAENFDPLKYSRLFVIAHVDQNLINSNKITPTKSFHFDLSKPAGASFRGRPSSSVIGNQSNIGTTPHRNTTTINNQLKTTAATATESATLTVTTTTMKTKAAAAAFWLQRGGGGSGSAAPVAAAAWRWQRQRGGSLWGRQ